MASCSFPFKPDQASISATQQAVELQEEYAVYRSLIAARYVVGSVRMIVIHDHTGVEPSTDLEKRLDDLQTSFTELSREMVADFKAKNTSALPLETRFALPLSYILISDNQMQKIFTAQDGWQEFYRQFPHSQGAMILSRVAFNSQMDMALGYVGNQSGWLAGAGYYFLMVKDQGAWKILREFMAWIS